jgi:carbon-monoxide dehydrogenase medium subunit
MATTKVEPKISAAPVAPVEKYHGLTPQHLIDLAGVSELRGVRADGADIVIGAMTTQHDVIGSELLSTKVPILREAALQIADPQVRYCGTIGGNVANGDPGNDMPAVMMCLGATYEVLGPDGTRRIAARAYYQGTFLTALKADEIVTAIRIPAPAAGHGHAYEKLKRKVGDYATAAAAVLLTVSGGKVANCSIGLTNVADRPLWAEDAGKILVGSNLDPATIKRAVAAAEAITAPASDTRGPAAYRTKVAGVMVARALARARQNAKA